MKIEQLNEFFNKSPEAAKYQATILKPLSNNAVLDLGVVPWGGNQSIILEVSRETNLMHNMLKNGRLQDIMRISTGGVYRALAETMIYLMSANDRMIKDDIAYFNGLLMSLQIGATDVIDEAKVILSGQYSTAIGNSFAQQAKRIFKDTIKSSIPQNKRKKHKQSTGGQDWDDFFWDADQPF